MLPLNTAYFRELNEESAYWLGLIQADGCIYADKRKPALTLSIDLHEDDAYILESFKRCIGAESHEIKRGKGNAVRIRISSNELCSDLMRLGIESSKSFSGAFAKVPDKYLRHYIRGVFDGDGCITSKPKRKSFTPRSAIVGGKSFCDWALSSVKEAAGITSGGVYPSSTIYSMEFSGFKQNARFYEWVYTDAGIYMVRKKAKFEELFSIKYAESNSDRRFLLPKIA